MTKLDDLLAKWPLPEQGQLAADEAAEQLVTAVQAGQLPANIDESLLAPPLPKTNDDQDTSTVRTSKPGKAPGIGVETKMAKDRTRDRTSFQELAKLATTPPPPASTSGPHAPPPPSATSSGSMGVTRGEEAQSSDSGIVDLKAIASADPSGSQRAQTTPLASQGLFDDDSAPAKPAVSEQAAAKAVSSAVAQPTSTATPSTPPKKVEEEKKAGEKKKGSGGIVIVLGALAGAAAIAAGVFFYVKSQHAHHASMASVSVTAPEKAGGTTTKVQPGTTATAAASVAQVDTDTADTNNPTQTVGGKPMFKFHSKAGGGAAGATSATPDSTVAVNGIDPKLIANLPTGGAGGGNGDLTEAMKAAAGGGTGLGGGGSAATNQGSAFAPGSVPQRPSQGQVAGAINSVMPSVRACLGSDDPVSHANVVLQSDGTVKSVGVYGFAAGKPQEACIKAALSKITVSPFAEATYPVPVTVRPN